MQHGYPDYPERIFKGTPVTCTDCGNTFYKITRCHDTKTKKFCDLCIALHKKIAKRKHLAKKRLKLRIKKHLAEKGKILNPQNIHYPPDCF